MQYSYSPLTVKKLLLILIGILIIIIFWYTATHGVVTINNKQPYQLVDASNGKVRESSGGVLIAPSGEHTLRITNDEGQYIQQVKVGRFFTFSQVDIPAALQYHVTRVAAGTLENLLPVNNTDAYISYSSSQRQNILLRHLPDDPTGIRAVPHTIALTSSEVESVNGKLLGFTSVLESQSDLTPVLFDFNPEVTPGVSAISYSEEQAPLIVPPSTSNHSTFGIVTAQENGPRMDIFSGVDLKTSFENLGEVASGAQGSGLIGLSSEYVVVGTGSSFLQGDTSVTTQSESSEDPPEEQDLAISVYDIDSKNKVGDFNVNNQDAVSAITITNDGKRVAIVSDQYISVYSVESKELLYRFNSLFATDVMWKDNSRLIFSSVNNGVFLLDTNKNSAQTLFSSKNLRISSFNIVGEKILLTAYSSLNDKNSPVADGYTVDLTQPNATNDLLNKLPYTEGSIKIMSLNNKIYAASDIAESSFRSPNGDFVEPGFRITDTVSPILQESVRNYLQKNVKNYQQYPLVFGENL